jgi:hypothetical protein
MKKFSLIFILIALVLGSRKTNAQCNGPIYDTTYINSCGSIGGLQIDSFITPLGCDSILATITVNHPIFNINVNDTICLGSVYTFADGTSQIINNYMSYTSNFTTVNGCDSIINESINLNLTYTNTNFVTTCKYETVVLPTSNLIAIKDTIINFTFLSTHLCDSVEIYDIKVFNKDTTTFIQNVCYDGKTNISDSSLIENIKADTSIVFNFFNSNFCDSTVVNIINVIPIDSSSFKDTVCFLDNWMGPDNIIYYEIMQDTTISLSFPRPNDCDSIVFANITCLKADTNVTLVNTTLSVPLITGATYQWFNKVDSTAVIGANSNIFNATQNGRYFVKIILNGCVFYSSAQVILLVSNHSVDLNNISIYPNPFTNEVFISGLNVTTTVTNMFGNLIVKTTNNDIKTNSWPKGVYTFCIKKEGFSSIYKLVK